MAEFQENVRITWAAEQPLQVAQDLITRLTEANASLDKLAQSGAFATLSTQFGGLARGIETGLNAQLRITLGLLDQVTTAAALAAETVRRVNQGRSESVANLPVGRDPVTGRFISLRDLQGTGMGGGEGPTSAETFRRLTQNAGQYPQQFVTAGERQMIQEYLSSQQPFVEQPGYPKDLSDPRAATFRRLLAGTPLGAPQAPPFGAYPSDVTMLAQLQRYGYAQDYAAIQQAMGAPGPYAQRFQNILAGVPPGVTTGLGVGQFQGGYNAFANMPATMLGPSVVAGGGPTTTYGVGQYAGGFNAFGSGTQQAAQAQQQLGQAATRANRAIQQQAGDVDLLNNRFARHITWILQGIVVWESFRVVAGIVREVYDQVVALESASARLAFVQGGTVAQARQQVVVASIAGAQYGIGPIEAGRGALVAAQVGATGAQQEQARQMALVFGAQEYNNILSEVIQTQKRAEAAGLAHVDVMGFIATAYAEVPGTIETYFDALQAGETIYKDLGTSAEAAGLIVAKVAYAMESSADAAANTVQTIFNRLRKPEIQAQLQQGFGIAAGPVPQMLNEATAALEQLIQTGQDQRAQDLINLLAGGTINVQRIREAPLAFKAIGDALRDSGGELKNFNDLMGNVADTTSVKIGQLTASWQLFLQAIGNTSAMRGTFDWMKTQLDELAQAMRTSAEIDVYKAMPEESQRHYAEMFARQFGVTAEYTAPRGAGSFGGIQPERDFIGFRPTAEMIAASGGNEAQARIDLYQAFAVWLAHVFSTSTATRPPMGFGMDVPMPGTPSLSPRALPPPPFQAAGQIFRDVPTAGGVQGEYRHAGGAGAFLSEYERQQQTLRNIPGYVAPKSEAITLLDKFGNVILQGNYNMEAVNETLSVLRERGGNLAEALGRAAEAADNFGGFRRLADDVNINALRQSAETWQRRIEQFEPGVQDYEQRQIFAYWDRATQTWQKIEASSQAIAFATEDTADLMRQQITGVFNLPAGETAYVAFEALQAGFVPFDRLAQIGTNSSQAMQDLGRTSTSTTGAVAGLGAAATAAAGALRGGGAGAVQGGTSQAQARQQYLAYVAAQNARDALSARTVADYGAQLGDEVMRPRPSQPPYGPWTPGNVGPQPTALTVNIQTRNTILLDGRKIAENLSSSYFNQLATLNRAGSMASV